MVTLKLRKIGNKRKTPKCAYGVVQQMGHVKLVAVGCFQRMQSVLTGAVDYRGDWICSLVCVQVKDNVYRKVGMCCLNMEDYKEYVSDEVLILA